MSRRSSLRGDFGRVKTPMGLERFEVEKYRFWTCSKSAENRAANSRWVDGHRRHRYGGICVCQNCYGFRAIWSCKKIAQLRLPFLKLYYKSWKKYLRHTSHFCWVKILWAWFSPFVSTLSLPGYELKWREAKRVILIAWNRLKIGQQVAHG